MSDSYKRDRLLWHKQATRPEGLSGHAKRPLHLRPGSHALPGLFYFELLIL